MRLDATNKVLMVQPAKESISTGRVSAAGRGTQSKPDLLRVLQNSSSPGRYVRREKRRETARHHTVVGHQPHLENVGGIVDKEAVLQIPQPRLGFALCQVDVEDDRKPVVLTLPKHSYF